MLDFIYFAFSPFCINSFFVSYLIWSGLLYKPSIFSMYFYSVIWMIEMEFFSFRGALSTVFLFATIFLATTFFRKNIKFKLDTAKKDIIRVNYIINSNYYENRYTYTYNYKYSQECDILNEKTRYKIFQNNTGKYA